MLNWSLIPVCSRSRWLSTQQLSSTGSSFDFLSVFLWTCSHWNMHWIRALLVIHYLSRLPWWPGQACWSHNRTWSLFVKSDMRQQIVGRWHCLWWPSFSRHPATGQWRLYCDRIGWIAPTCYLIGSGLPKSHQAIVSQPLWTSISQMYFKSSSNHRIASINSL